MVNAMLAIINFLIFIVVAGITMTLCIIGLIWAIVEAIIEAIVKTITS